jgi:tetratricopeptide (TPR) repeat protein
MSGKHATAHAHEHVESLEKKGWALFEAGSWQSAIAEFDELLKIDDANEGALQGKIASLRKLRKFDEAATQLQEALKKKPDHAGILCEQVWLDVDQRKYAEGVADLDKVFAHSPATAALLAWKVSLLRSLERFDEAYQVARGALKTYPENISILLQLAWVHFYQNHLEEASDTFTEIVRSDPRNEEAYQGLIATYRLRGRFADAKREVQYAMKVFPASVGIQSELAWVSFACEDFDEAVKVFRKVLTMTPSDPRCFINLAWALASEDEKESLAEAYTQCQAALDLEPDLPEALGCLGVVAFRQGRTHEAETYLQRNIKADAAHGQYADLAALYVHMGRYTEAQGILTQGLTVRPQEAALHLELGNLYNHTEEPKKALLEFRQAAILDPASADFSQALAISLLDNNKAAEAENLLRYAIRNLDEIRRWKLHLALSQVLVQLAEDTSNPDLLSDALKEVNCALRLRPSHADPQFYNGIVRFKLEDLGGSLKAFRRCCEIDPERVEAEVNAKRIQAMMREETIRSRASLVASLVVGVVALCQLVGLWFVRLRGGPVSDVMITVLVPVCLGLLVVSVLLPSLTKLKLTGIEAELSEPKPKAVAAGPKGDIGFGRGSSAPVKI